MTVTYRDIKADILGKITRGEWPPGSALPGELELAETYGAARATVNRAMRELVEDGIIERKRKSGSRVRLSPLRQARFDIPVIRTEIEELGRSYRYLPLTAAVEAAPDWLCARLSLAAGGPVRHVTCLHLADDLPWQYEDRWINIALLPEARTADFTTTAPTEWLVAHIPFSAVEISISATLADSETASHLGCRPGEALLMTERMTRWNGEAVTYVRFLHRPGHRMTTRY